MKLHLLTAEFHCPVWKHITNAQQVFDQCVKTSTAMQTQASCVQRILLASCPLKPLPHCSLSFFFNWKKLLLPLCGISNTALCFRALKWKHREHGPTKGPVSYLSSCSVGTAWYEDSRQTVVCPKYLFPSKAKHLGAETKIKLKYLLA